MTFAPWARVIEQMGKFAAGESTGMCAITLCLCSQESIRALMRWCSRIFASPGNPITASSPVRSMTIAPARSMRGPPHA